MSAIAKPAAPYIRFRAQLGDNGVTHYDIELLRWHPSWWKRCWKAAVEDLGIGILTPLFTIWYIINVGAVNIEAGQCDDCGAEPDNGFGREGAFYCERCWRKRQ